MYAYTRTQLHTYRHTYLHNIPTCTHTLTLGINPPNTAFMERETFNCYASRNGDGDHDDVNAYHADHADGTESVQARIARK